MQVTFADTLGAAKHHEVRCLYHTDVSCALQVTFADALGAAKHQEDSEVTSKNEAKKLAFYLFWNIKPSFNRCSSFVLKRFVGSLHDASMMQTSRPRQSL